MWRKAGRSEHSQGCIEVDTEIDSRDFTGSGTSMQIAHKPYCGYVHVRDSHEPATILTTPEFDWAVFLDGVLRGDFDHMLAPLGRRSLSGWRLRLLRLVLNTGQRAKPLDTR